MEFSKEENGIMEFSKEENGIMEFSKEENGIMEFSKKENGIMGFSKEALEHMINSWTFSTKDVIEKSDMPESRKEQLLDPSFSLKEIFDPHSAEWKSSKMNLKEKLGVIRDFASNMRRFTGLMDHYSKEVKQDYTNEYECYFVIYQSFEIYFRALENKDFTINEELLENPENYKKILNKYIYELIDESKCQTSFTSYGSRAFFDPAASEWQWDGLSVPAKLDILKDLLSVDNLFSSILLIYAKNMTDANKIGVQFALFHALVLYLREIWDLNPPPSKFQKRSYYG